MIKKNWSLTFCFSNKMLFKLKFQREDFFSKQYVRDFGEGKIAKTIIEANPKE